jgi:hypothetical protein
LFAALSCGFVLAQAADPSAPPVPAANELSNAILEWTPPALAQLSARAVAKESFTLDRNMLAAAAAMTRDNDADVKQTIAKLDGVSVHILRFGDPATIDRGQIDAIRDAYHLRGWKHLVTTTDATSPAHNGGPIHDQTTDVWVVLDGANVRGGVVLVESPRSLTLATVAGNLSPADLLRLRGHFGIPEFNGGALAGKSQ